MIETLKMLEKIYYELGKVDSPETQMGIVAARDIVNQHIDNLLKAHEMAWKDAKISQKDGENK